jgi:PAS domain-containing protein
LDSGNSVLTIEDISDQQILQKGLDKYHGNIREGFISVGDDNRILDMNQQAADMFDLSDPKPLVGEGLFDVCFTEGESKVRAALAEASHTGGESSVTTEVGIGDRWLEIRVYSHGNGHAIYLDDITEQRHQQQQLTFAESFIENSHETYIVVEVDTGVIVDTNTKARNWFEAD